MAICNLFNELTSTSGNFLMFSQYVEDLTRNNSDGDNWKVVPSKFIAMNIDYSKFNPIISDELDTTDLNILIPQYFQNYYENGCAYGKNTVRDADWTPENAKNFFWNALFDCNLLSVKTYDENANYVPEIVYHNDINMHSYNEHQGLGYGEIYCYIPSDAKKTICQVVKAEDRFADGTNTNTHLEGFNSDTYLIGNYSKIYYYNQDHNISCNSDELADLPAIENEINENHFNINTIAVLYSIYVKQNDNWEELYSNIPLGIYIAGNFNGNNLTNTITKHVTTSYDSGTAYGLRICTRFSATSNGKLIEYNTDITADTSDYSNICQMMTGMNENLYRMREVSNAVTNTIQEYKDSLSIIKNNRTNIPYIKIINGEEYWFINGRKVSPTKTTSFIPISTDELNNFNYNFSWYTN